MIRRYRVSDIELHGTHQVAVLLRARSTRIGVGPSPVARAVLLILCRVRVWRGEGGVSYYTTALETNILTVGAV